MTENAKEFRDATTQNISNNYTLNKAFRFQSNCRLTLLPKGLIILQYALSAVAIRTVNFFSQHQKQAVSDMFCKYSLLHYRSTGTVPISVFGLTVKPGHFLFLFGTLGIVPVNRVIVKNKSNLSSPMLSEFLYIF